MPKYRVACNKYGWAVVEAANAEDALDRAEQMPDSDFNWSDAGDHEVVERADE